MKVGSELSLLDIKFIPLQMNFYYSYPQHSFLFHEMSESTPKEETLIVLQKYRWEQDFIVPCETSRTDRQKAILTTR